VILGLIAANVIVFAVEVARGADPMSPTGAQLVDLGANFTPRTLHGEPWRMVTAMFLHFGLIHLGMNMLCLWQGRIVEQLFGPRRFAAIYFASGLVGAAATLLRTAPAVSAGASGAVFGVYGAFAAFLWLRRAHIPVDVWHKTARSMATFLGLNLVIGLSVPGIDMRAHVGGLLAGFGCGAAMIVGERAKAQATARAIALVGAAIAICAAALVLAPKPTLGDPVILDDVAPTEQRCIDRWNQITAQIPEHLTGEQAALQIERDVIAPWKEMRARVAGHVSPSVETYLDARQQAWETFVVYLRAPAADQARLLGDFKAKSAAADAAARAVSP
jgi:rhomboid protease GluP